MVQICFHTQETTPATICNSLFFWCRYWKLDLFSEPTLITGVFPITLTLLPQLHVIDMIYQIYWKLQRKRANYRKKCENCGGKSCVCVCVRSSKPLDPYLSPIPLPWRQCSPALPNNPSAHFHHVIPPLTPSPIPSSFFYHRNSIMYLLSLPGLILISYTFAICQRLALEPV